VDLRTPGAGYTAITQALTKVLFFNGSFTPGFLRWRKIQQIIIALAFNARVSKDQQLRLFVTLAYMGIHNGREITGLSQAAQEYFGKDFQNLTAILLLLARLGLRAGEMVALQLEDIDWRAGELLIRGKGLRHDRMPRPADVGEVLASYLRRDRPPCQTRRLFVCMRAPRRSFAGPSTLTTIA